MNKENVLGLVSEREIEFVRLQFVDILGHPKNIVLPAARLESALNDGVMFDGSSIAGYATIEESDYIAKPDLDSMLVLPEQVAKQPTVRFNCDIYDPSNQRYLGDTKYVLERVLERTNGMRLHVGPEAEFYLFKKNGNSPTLEPNDSAGYFDLSHIDLAEGVRADITTVLEQMGIPVHGAHHEVGKGQHEIDLCHTDAVDMADRVISYKYIVKLIAATHNLHATFMPKPIHGAAGNGMHMHMSLVDKDGKNLFYEPNSEDGTSDIFPSFIAGVMEHVKAMTAILNPTINSYKRLVPGYEAPTYICWADMNRSAMVRIPPERGPGTRFELRSPDPSGNTYLQFAVALAAGLDGMERGLEPPAKVEGDLYKMGWEKRREMGIGNLPDNLHHALSFMEESDLMRETLGEHVYEHFLRIKHREWEVYRTMVTPWEIDNYLTTI